MVSNVPLVTFDYHHFITKGNDIEHEGACLKVYVANLENGTHYFYSYKRIVEPLEGHSLLTTPKCK